MALANITSKIRANLIAKTFHNDLVNSRHVLDIGCGTGVVAKRLSEIYSLIKIEGCDIENYLITDIKFKIQKQFNKLPYPDKKFDVSMFNDVLHHTEYSNQENLIKESMRVSKKVLIFELLPTTVNKVGDFLLNKIHNPNMDIPFTYKTPKDWTNLIKKLGYASRRINVTKPIFYPFNHVGFVITE